MDIKAQLEDAQKRQQEVVAQISTLEQVAASLILLHITFSFTLGLNGL